MDTLLLPVLVGCPSWSSLLMEDGWVLQSSARELALLLGTSSINPGRRAVAGSISLISDSFLGVTTDTRKDARIVVQGQ